MFAHEPVLVRIEISGIKADAALPDDGNTAACRRGLRESLGARLRNGARAAEKLVPCPGDAELLDGDGGVHFIEGDIDENIWLGLDLLLGVGEGLVADPVQSVPNAELPDDGDVAACRHGLHEGLGARLRDGAQAADKLALCPVNAEIIDSDGGARPVGDDIDEQNWLGLDFLLGIGEGVIADPVQRV
eukprot:CAMPEP_0177224090 /NCGR_PEP_ID=MMETSP0367-20130122/38834_1 /TAXON_ID=447022 ORGANISM="Scrippsiella hangoei-like, Strain SHHI-4" /NCGR_SAMPLE_ID=MMETSP0367 /ASSEMBLY_ACC=CAM_ASM_000362 /LENGTH=187 /DNA_ID=CAMNT_0018674107 /DNA_START=301 /DNA_END=864 /DNA_ORIENTATION=+